MSCDLDRENVTTGHVNFWKCAVKLMPCAHDHENVKFLMPKLKKV